MHNNTNNNTNVNHDTNDTGGRMTRSKRKALAALFAAVSLAGCGGGTQADPESAQAAAAAAATDAGTTRVAAPLSSSEAPGMGTLVEAAAWVPLANEWGAFSLPAAATVRYGANNTWVERNLSAGPGECTNAFFGTDPLPGTVKRCEVDSIDVPPPPPAGSWVFAGNEWQTITLTSARRVRYGANGTWLERDLPAGQVLCTNTFFGTDPLPGIVKRCEVFEESVSPPPPPTGSWVLAGSEGQAFTLLAARRMRYGADGVWLERDLPAGQVSCTNTFFGSDPLPGVVKRCEVWEETGSPPPPPAPPVITSFTPTSGPVFTVVTISGTGFDLATGASVGGVTATFELVSPTLVRVRVPAGAASGRIALTAGSAATVSLGDFTVTQPASVPTVSSVTPTTVAPGGQITVSGTALTEVASARLGSVTLTIVSQTATSLVLALPPTAESGTLVLVDRTGVARDAATIQVLVPMTVSGFSPTTVTRGQTLTITGRGLDRVTTVRFVGADAPVASRSGSTSITVTVPTAASSGRVTLIANGGDQVTSGSDVTIIDAVTVVTQVHRVGVGGTVSVTGTGLDRVSSIQLGGSNVGITARSATSVSFVVPADVICADIVLRLDDGSGVPAGSVITGSDCGLRSAGVEFAQLLSQRTDDPRLRLAAGKETWVRAFVVSSNAGTPAPQVRVQGTDASGHLLGSLVMSGPSALPLLASGAAVPDSLRVDDSRTFRAELPAAWVQPGLQLRVQAGESEDPSTIVDANPSIVDSGGLRVVVVPLWSGPYGPALPGADTVQQLVASRFPVAADRISVSIRAPYALTSVTSGVQTSSQWSNALSELESLRDLEAPTVVYYGLVQPRVGGGIAGIGYVNSIGSQFPALSSLGWDASRAAWSQTMIHELGHNLSRSHAPCGGVSSFDPAFPYADGSIGPNPAFDPGTDQIGGIAGQYDVMGYCSGTFFSDYNLSGVKNFLEARPMAMKTAAKQADKADAAPVWLVIRGTVDADGARVRTVRAATDTTQPPERGGRSGSHTLRLTTRAGTVSDHAIDAIEVDHVDGESHFTLRVANPGPLQRIEIVRQGKVVFTRDTEAAPVNTRAKAAVGSTAAGVRTTGGGWVMTWGAADHPRASLTLVIGTSRRVLAVDAEGGRWTIPTATLQDLPPGGHVELSLSNGIDTLLLKLARP